MVELSFRNTKTCTGEWVHEYTSAWVRAWTHGEGLEGWRERSSEETMKRGRECGLVLRLVVHYFFPFPRHCSCTAVSANSLHSPGSFLSPYTPPTSLRCSDRVRFVLVFHSLGREAVCMRVQPRVSTACAATRVDCVCSHACRVDRVERERVMSTEAVYSSRVEPAATRGHRPGRYLAVRIHPISRRRQCTPRQHSDRHATSV